MVQMDTAFVYEKLVIPIVTYFNCHDWPYLYLPWLTCSMKGGVDDVNEGCNDKEKWHKAI